MIMLIFYITIFLYIILKGFYVSIPHIIRSFSVRKNTEFIITSIQLESLPILFNIPKINLLIFFINFFIFIVLSIFFNDTNTFCAGLPKLVDEVLKESVDNLKNSLEVKEIEKFSALAIYKDNSYIKTLYKYNIPSLNRNKIFFIDRTTIQEIEEICSDLNSICKKSVNSFNEIFQYQKIINLKKENDIIIYKRMAQILYEENIFKLENLRLCNKQLGIPLYNKLYNQTFFSEKSLSEFLALKSKIPTQLITSKIFPFLNLDKETLPKNVNYFNTELNIVLTKKQCYSLMILDKKTTVKATCTDSAKIYDNHPIINQKMVKNKVISEIFDSELNKVLKVTDLLVKCEAPNGKETNLLEGGFGIIEAYVYYTKCMLKTVNLLDLENKRLDVLKDSLSNLYDKKAILGLENVKLNINNINLKNINQPEHLLNFQKLRILNKSLVYDSSDLFNKSEFYVNKNVQLRFKKIADIFFQQILFKDLKMIEDIERQKNNMVVDYQKLNQIIENSQLENSVNKNLLKKIKERC